MMIQGSCCCGAVRFELTAPPTMMATCHCTRCRKVGLSTFVFVDRASFRWVEGQDMVESYQPDPPYQFARCFCRRCGTALGEPLSPADDFPIAANCLDSDPGVRNRFHEFVAEKPAWYEICDGAKQFAGHPVRAP
ncbi:GFA family protein [Phenylobacterium sp. 20VBR1]|uniref:GFA family protein n=2 Tax=Phenylobacterium glaciei TaxID=2803784 RepID=A0A941CY16_9CAUL|nr:GFA family protein [Phenylobacterium glaciei]